ncbi:c-type cytochrome biogenesis protein CcmI [Thalassospira sp. GO-4]|jgi:cytochrome c-type biogenesis protein CcmH|uniref:c-type cytochrome biogenesis protein CcmI n=1 Tax=Thalassospira sp. GO-4 TaxID=2946605 RepID=UPI00202563BD|nr:c-type cytochrome biogenesis protein CcmI [Thalassospira sp. GO-4]URK16206.1 c-type cytochrome biogenesis protein CcmI [Thalassospira sp. GO-4]
MTIWIVLAAITLLVAGFVLWPVLRQRETGADAASDDDDQNGNSELNHDLAVYRDQLAEIERDIERGVLSTEQANAARIEVQRRILNADQRIKARESGATSGIGKPSLRIYSALAIVLFLIGGFGLYLDLGSPDMPDRPIASRADEINAIQQAESINSNRLAALNRAVSDLSQKLIADPENLKGWELLGASLMALGRPVEAQTAFLEAVKLSDRDGDYLAMYAESLIRGDNGQINATARGVLKEAATTQSGDPRIQYYLGLADAQDGNIAAAVDRWIALANSAPADAGWLPMVVARIKDAALAQGIDIEGRLDVAKAAPSNGPSQDDVAAAQQMTPEERQDMINSMVDGLADRLDGNPDDPEGWARLMQAYMVLGKQDKAQAAYQKASDVFADQPDLVARFDALAKEIGITAN